MNAIDNLEISIKALKAYPIGKNIIKDMLVKLSEIRSELVSQENVVEVINHYFPNSKVVEMLIPEKYKEEVEQFLRNKSVWQVEEDNPNKE